MAENRIEQTTPETNVQADQKAYEQLPESKEQFLEQQENAPTTNVSQKIDRVPNAVVAAPSRARPDADDVTIRVEKILEEGLGPLYAGLPEEAKPIFKKKGEEAATEISTMVSSFRVEVSKVVRLIRDWLLTIPRVNRFFLEQEAKIKTDAIIEYAEARKEDLVKQP